MKVTKQYFSGYYFLLYRRLETREMNKWYRIFLTFHNSWDEKDYLRILSILPTKIPGKFSHPFANPT